MPKATRIDPYGNFNFLVDIGVSDAFPRKWEGPSFNAKGNEVAIETLTLCCEGIERQ